MTTTESLVRGRVRSLCRALSPLLGDDPDLTRTRASLAEPLRLAVVGRVSTGKSTLVNALVGRRVAPTSAGECTKVVTWYRYGEPDQARLVLHDGRSLRVRLVDRALPDELGVPASEVARLEVWLTSRALRHLTLIDTPGLGTTNEDQETATRAAILGVERESQIAAGQADALLFLIGEAARRSDLDFLDDFRASSGSLTPSSVNAVGVLAKSDGTGSGVLDETDPFKLAGDQAARLASTHRGVLSDVLPVSGLLAETALTGVITETLAAALGAQVDQDPALLAVSQDPELEPLAAAFGPYGLVAGRDVAAAGASKLREWCLETSGIRLLEEVVHGRLVPRSDLLKASRGLSTLESVSRRLPTELREDALALLEEARLDPTLHAIGELQAMERLLAERPDSPLLPALAGFVDGAEDAVLLVGGAEVGSPAEQARGLSAEATRSAALATSAAEVAAGRVLARSYQLLARRLP
ncbi:conserved hypothetical protein [metagenome]|uniref:Dynamin N-terminal domain-containing protein n=1 Tax=metagenome TaxID=256318 RepID=A0A2P2BXC3_9ZZZZ